MNDVVRIYVAHADDSVATIFGDPVVAGEDVEIGIPGGRSVTVNAHADVARGHKIAIHQIPQGTRVLKYGHVIGRATHDIAAGEHVHVHNVESERGRGDLAVEKP